MSRRIVVLTVLAMLVAIGLFGAPLAVGAARFYQQDEQVELQRSAYSAALAVSADLVKGRAVDSLPPAHGSTLTVYDRGGATIAGQGPARSSLARRAAVSGQVRTGTEGADIVVAVPVLNNRAVLGVVRAATSQHESHRHTALAWATMLGLACVAILAGWVFARWQSRKLAAPLRTLSTVAGRLGDGDFSARSAPSGIPEIDSVSASLNVTAARLDDLVGRERSFTANASHQLRTPLAGVRLSLDAALQQPDADPRAAIRTALGAVDRLERTVADLLSLARDVRSERVQTLDVCALVAGVCDAYAPRLRSQGRSLHVVCDPAVGPARASAAAVRQVVAVLLDNAEVHGAGAVTATVRDAATAVAVDIEDEGAGIDVPESALFERRSTESADHGIGLALARSLAEAEGGRLRLARRHPPTFSLLLPPAPESEN